MKNHQRDEFGAEHMSGRRRRSSRNGIRFRDAGGPLPVLRWDANSSQSRFGY